MPKTERGTLSEIQRESRKDLVSWRDREAEGEEREEAQEARGGWKRDQGDGASGRRRRAEKLEEK